MSSKRAETLGGHVELTEGSNTGQTVGDDSLERGHRALPTFKEWGAMPRLPEGEVSTKII